MSKHFLLLLILFLGCSQADTPPLGLVSGTIQIDGKPGAEVDVAFTPVAGGRASTGTTDSSGKYELVYSTTAMGAVLGEHRVVIRNHASNDLNDPDAPMVPTGMVTNAHTAVEKTVEVKSGANTIDLTYP